MSPYEIAKEMYGDGELEAIIAYCANIGAVYVDSECFICVYPTHSSLIGTKSKQAIKIQSKKAIDKPDTWYVFIAVGNLKKILELPNQRKYIAYERFDKSFRLIEANRVRRLI